MPVFKLKNVIFLLYFDIKFFSFVAEKILFKINVINIL